MSVDVLGLGTYVVWECLGVGNGVFCTDIDMCIFR